MAPLPVRTFLLPDDGVLEGVREGVREGSC